MIAAAGRRLLLLLTLTSLSAAAASAAAADPEIGVCRQKCPSQHQSNIAEQNACLHLCEDHADAKSKKESEIQICKQDCRSTRKKICELECGRKEKRGDDEQRANPVGGWRKGKKIEEICKQWCWDLPAGGAGEIECLRDCFKVYGVRGILLLEWKSWRASRWITSQD